MQAFESTTGRGTSASSRTSCSRAIILARDGVLDLADFADGGAEAIPEPAPSRSLVAVERHHIQQVLEHSSWRIEGSMGAAQVLGLRPSTLRTRMRKLGIGRPPKASPQPVA